MCSWTSLSVSHRTQPASFALPLSASIGTPSSLIIGSSAAFRHSMEYLCSESSPTPLAFPAFSPLGILLTVSQQQLSPYRTSTGMSLAAATAMSSSLAQVGSNSKCGTL
uniref:Uncharacterized protein n=1 Tax=Arundo donax TaxID=35708 RepID=A0A0A9GB36_ARUDO